MPGVGSP
jgi:hypothetical protein